MTITSRIMPSHRQDTIRFLLLPAMSACALLTVRLFELGLTSDGWLALLGGLLPVMGAHALLYRQNARAGNTSVAEWQL
ncbi:hypothetical protein [Thiomonas sp. 13-64-67]|jgi:hypothetical protein|uniref:hypothetical protein n=1 Tax=Thiomonas sp. 13-64-67 TaxID=1970447 RepID=UPI000BCB9146|nr:hypothetical protein [Thiomonas sp. 13-64-67]OZB70454.1 MAG: hypothetical protein B7X30_08445 [Thiomonas sp. 13-64-67]